jgi:hypothetical protein
MNDRTSTWSFTRETLWRRAPGSPAARRAPSSRPCFARSFTREIFLQSHLMPSPDLALQPLGAVKPTTQTNYHPQTTADRHAIPNQKGNDMPT